MVLSGQHWLLTFSLISYVVNLFRPTPTVSGLATSISRKLLGGPYASFRFCGLVYSLLVSAMASAIASRYRFEQTSSYRLHFRSAEEQLTCDIPTRSRVNIPALWLDKSCHSVTVHMWSWKCFKWLFITFCRVMPSVYSVILSCDLISVIKACAVQFLMLNDGIGSY